MALTILERHHLRELPPLLGPRVATHAQEQCRTESDGREFLFQNHDFHAATLTLQKILATLKQSFFPVYSESGFAF